MDRDNDGCIMKTLRGSRTISSGSPEDVLPRVMQVYVQDTTVEVNISSTT